MTGSVNGMIKEAKETSCTVEGDLMVGVTRGAVDLRRFYTASWLSTQSFMITQSHEDKSDGAKKPGHCPKKRGKNNK